MNILNIIGRGKEIFIEDITTHERQLREIIVASRFLVIGGGGSIGQAVTREIFKRNPRALHVVDISENNLAELVRDIRSSFGYIQGDFRTFSLDVGSLEFNAFFRADGLYDYVLNLSALKHVRSEKDPYSLMRMIDVNIFNTNKTIQQSIGKGVKKYFCVSTDKAANPVSMMGASKRIMEMFLIQRSSDICISTARFANVAFSDGSLLHSFNQRIQKHQPIVAPNDIKRYFVLPKESGELCMMSCLLGDNRDIFFPALKENLHLVCFSDIMKRYLQELGYEPYLCESEEEARSLTGSLIPRGKWPCFLSVSDTSGEKGYEEFFTEDEVIDDQRFKNIHIIKNNVQFDRDKLIYFEKSIDSIKSSDCWEKQDIVQLFSELIPNFAHLERQKSLDEKM